MRERWVWMVAVASGVLVVLLAWAFARSQNPTDARPQAAAVSVSASASAALPAPRNLPKDLAKDLPEDPQVQVGRQVYAAQNCARCHAVAGTGNPRVPLDGVADRLDAQGLRDWALATGPAATALSPRTAEMKKPNQELPEADIQALVLWLQTLRTGQ